MGIKKELKPITKAINEWTMKNFGIRTNLGTDFGALPTKNEIYYTLVVGTQDAETFMEDVSTRFPDLKADYFLWCLMHEIGHCMTDDEWTEDEQNRFDEQLKRMTEIENTREKSFWYYSMPNEFFATRWAGEYMEVHPKKIKKFWNKIQPMILEFYLKNNLTNE